MQLRADEKVNDKITIIIFIKVLISEVPETSLRHCSLSLLTQDRD